MKKYFIRKIVSLIVTLFLISIITFVAFSVIPGDAALSKAGTNATKEQIESIREEMGLNKPILERYVNWSLKAVRGDFGESFQYTGYTVKDLIMDRMVYTIILSVISILIILVISIPLGVIAAKYHGGIVNYVITAVTQLNMAIPPFFLGIIMTYIFGVILRWFRVGDCPNPMENIWGAVGYLIFPAIAMAIPKIAMIVKFLKNSIVEQLDSDYVRTAYGKGCSQNRVLYGHVLKNALIPVITFIGIVAAEVLAGSIIIEQVFSVPGLGRLLVTAILNRDYPVVQAAVIYITAAVIIVNMLVDMIYHVADPRVDIKNRGEDA